VDDSAIRVNVRVPQIRSETGCVLVALPLGEGAGRAGEAELDQLIDGGMRQERRPDRRGGARGPPDRGQARRVLALTGELFPQREARSPGMSSTSPRRGRRSTSDNQLLLRSVARFGLAGSFAMSPPTSRAANRKS
jgi:hypothetical protein